MPWFVFTSSFYTHGLLLGLAWRDCHADEPGFAMLHVLISATVVGAAGVATWGALLHRAEGRRPVTPALGAAALVVALLWLAMAVWNLMTGPLEGLCGATGVPGWRPSILLVG
ncbi:hypothetical protein WJ438_15640 [Streptomyces sp. GD-15H]|uniref:hypothetical protein n=1 Tax=Streptomyces sp. GD-15H TaxID=3129112 RepID=UPI003246B53A